MRHPSPHFFSHFQYYFWVFNKGKTQSATSNHRRWTKECRRRVGVRMEGCSWWRLRTQSRWLVRWWRVALSRTCWRNGVGDVVNSVWALHAWRSEGRWCRRWGLRRVPVSLVVGRRWTHVSGVGLVLLVSRRRDCWEGKSEVETSLPTLAMAGHGGQRR